MKVVKSKILENIRISNKIYKLTCEFSGNIKPGQFFMLKTLDNSFLLPRPNFSDPWEMDLPLKI
ncbi:MAG: hypothetical protein K0Q47_982 [Sedimentibacter sp.]|nr:hypothetical protein [Sedimentibacter sp.]